MIERLSISLHAVEGESLLSYLQRLSRRVGLPLNILLERIGLRPQRSGYDFTRLAVLLSDHEVRDFSTATALEESSVRQMTLAHYDRVALDLSPVQAGEPRALTALGRKEWAYAGSSQLCPRCLRDDDAWRTAWKLTLTPICARHGVILVDRCPRCHARLLDALLLRMGRLGETTKCQNCGMALTRIRTAPASPRLIYAQEAAASKLPSQAAPSGDAAFFNDLRAVATLLLAVGTIDMLGPLPRSCRDAFARHVKARPETLRVARVPRDPALVAAVLPTAVEIAQLREGPLSDALTPLMDRLRGERPAQRRKTNRYLRGSQRVVRALESHRYLTKGRPIIPDLRRADRTYSFSFDADQIPQLIWPGAYDRHFVSLLPEVLPILGRRFCSTALAQFVTGSSWAEAHRALGFPGDEAPTLKAVYNHLLRNERIARFVNALERYALELESRSERIDYGARRRTFKNLLIPLRVWLRICTETGVSPGRTDRKRRYASAWLWGDLTGGNALGHAPSLKPYSRTSIWQTFADFENKSLPKLKEYLQRYAEQLLDEKGLWHDPPSIEAVLFDQVKLLTARQHQKRDSHRRTATRSSSA